MKKIEWVYREILYHCYEQKKYSLTQLELSTRLQISLSTVHHALQPLQQMGAINIKLKNFQIIDAQKILYHWASLRNLKRDIVYQTRAELPVRKMEAEMPPGIIFTAYSAYKFKFKDVPADYSEVYVYGKAEELQKRFPPNTKSPNLFVLAQDPFLERYGKTATRAQIFVDLWNLPEWYAKEFLMALQKRLEEKE